ncbi:indolepyruvate ferredoxin oxidoreductase subunit alpha [Geoglobus acetivorans]|uniref:Indolepyruvate oxidoreductase subunit IorA n=1 Tax=Geoglobus acetivorans TaxID=565033 RepID=A0A0A7GBG3_GEOAI|nr:indolepyruvate ferredoxin oxidoreductase alpha subunit [Geoglobus acetivorans]
MLKDVILDAPGKKVFLLGNEAIARGAIEAGIDVFSAYPGTPSSEITDTLNAACSHLKDRMEYRMEYAVNEKVAFEVAIGVSLAGKRGMTAMKHVGLNVAADPLFSFAYVGARGAFVCVSADDPSMHSSQNEQDNRWYGIAAKVPVVEPSSVNEAKEITKNAFELSENFSLPFILRSYTRLSHSSGVVELGEIPYKKIEKVEWERHPETDVVLPAHARRLKPRLQEKLKKLEDYFNGWDYNWVDEGDGRKGLIACGMSYNYAVEAMENLGVEMPVLKLSSMNPLPGKLITDFLSNLDEVLVVEEVDPVVEMQVRVMAAEFGVRVHGKMDGYLPENYEYNVSIVQKGIARLAGKDFDYSSYLTTAAELVKIAPPRPPVLCPGCPHTAVFYAIRNVVNEIGRTALPSDIGCYTLGINKPLEGVDITICMGASAGSSNGLSYVLSNPVIATIGDSTFFHTGIPPLINAVYNGNKFVLVVLDNSTTGMTGHQPHPGVDVRGCGEKADSIRIEDVCRALGVKFVEVVHSYNLRAVEDSLKRALSHDGVAVIIAKQPCAILWTRERRRKGIKIRSLEITDDCRECMKCVNEFTCPAIYIQEGKPEIDPALCVGCGVCASVCPHRAIRAAR